MTEQNITIEFKPFPNHYKFRDLTNQIFGILTVLGYIGQTPNGSRDAMWLCQCSCGNQKVAITARLNNGMIQSCGCLLNEQLHKGLKFKHGYARTRVHSIWQDMIRRCQNPKNKAFKNYGGRGIKVCERWFEFENFLADMGEPPSKKHSIDRKDNNGNYEPSNCKWATPMEQQNNRRNNRLITYQGKTQSMSMWCRELHISTSAVYNRLARHWSIEKIFSTPVRKIVFSGKFT